MLELCRALNIVALSNSAAYRSSSVLEGIPVLLTRDGVSSWGNHGSNMQFQPGGHGPPPFAHGPPPFAHGPPPFAHGPPPFAHGPPPGTTTTMQSISVVGMPMPMPMPGPSPTPARQQPAAAEFAAAPSTQATNNSDTAAAPASEAGGHAMPPEQEGLLQALLSSVMGSNMPAGVEVATSQESTPGGTVEHTTISIEASALNNALQGALGMHCDWVLRCLDECATCGCLDWCFFCQEMLPLGGYRRRWTAPNASDEHAVCACSQLQHHSCREAAAHGSAADTKCSALGRHPRRPTLRQPLSFHICTTGPSGSRWSATSVCWHPCQRHQYRTFQYATNRAGFCPPTHTFDGHGALWWWLSSCCYAATHCLATTLSTIQITIQVANGLALDVDVGGMTSWIARHMEQEDSIRAQANSNRSVEERIYGMLNPLVMPIMGEIAEGVARRLSEQQVDAVLAAARVR